MGFEYCVGWRGFCNCCNCELVFFCVMVRFVVVLEREGVVCNVVVVVVGGG